MLSSGDLSHLPSPLRACIIASETRFITTDRGHIRGHNDASHDARMRHFAHWLETIGTAEYHLHALSPDTFIRILGAYVDSLKNGDNPSRSTTLASKTICNYLTSAASFVSILTGRKWSIYDPASALAAQPRLHPYLAELAVASTAYMVSASTPKGAFYSCNV